VIKWLATPRRHLLRVVLITTAAPRLTFELSILRRCDELVECFTADEHVCELLDIDAGGNVYQEAEVVSGREHRLPA
jgi:hypothetical protein